MLFAAALLLQTFFSETLEVRITNVDVIVTARDGKPVSGLTKDDFEIYEDGAKKEITNFLEVRPGSDVTAEAALPDARRRRILLFVDNAGLHPLSRNAVLPHLQRFLEQTIRGGDEITIALWNQSLETETLTRNDPERIESALRRLSTQTASPGLTRQRDYQQELAELISAYRTRNEIPPWQDALSIVRSHAQQRLHDMNAKTAALKSLLASFRGAEGRKIAVVVTDEFTGESGR